MAISKEHYFGRGMHFISQDLSVDRSHYDRVHDREVVVVIGQEFSYTKKIALYLVEPEQCNPIPRGLENCNFWVRPEELHEYELKI